MFLYVHLCYPYIFIYWYINDFVEKSCKSFPASRLTYIEENCSNTLLWVCVTFRFPLTLSKSHNRNKNINNHIIKYLSVNMSN